MNIATQESPFTMVAKTCGCRDKRAVTYSFVDVYHNLCLDKREIILAQVEACERLLRTGTDEDKRTVQKEITELKIALGLMSQ